MLLCCLSKGPDMQQEIFQMFRKCVSLKVKPYLEDLRIYVKPEFAERNDWIAAKFRFGDKTLSMSISLHHLDYNSGINVSLDTKSGKRWLRSEVLHASSNDIPVYGYGVPEMNAQFDRIIKDMKLYFEKYMLV